MLKKLLQCVLGFVMTISMAFAAVNINTASEQELEALPGVGPAKAKAIVDYRKKNGNFKSLEDIKNVSGIGDATFNGLKGQIALSGATTVPADTKAAKDDKKDAKPSATKEKTKEVVKDTKEVAKDSKDVVKDAAKDVSKETTKVAKEVKDDVKAGEKKVEKVATKADKTADQSAAKAKK